ncbi:MAG: CheR family methyltransferase [Candidatus Goldiibacteriota bacterium]
MDEQEAFAEIKKTINNERGLDVNQYKENYLKRRFAVRMRALHKITYCEYLEKIKADPGEMNILLDRLTINVTEFFRDPEMYIEFENELLPALINEGKKKFRIWSAGCSTGEEPYSIAVSIEEAQDAMGVRNLTYEIYASDIDEKVLRAGVEGVYEARTMRNIAPNRRAKYFTDAGNEKYRVNDSIKEKIRFIRLNLMKPYEKNFFDVVFCRNVIIYFTKELQEEVMQTFYDSLRSGGILILGKTETMLLGFRNRFKCINIKERMFRKVDE